MNYVFHLGDMWAARDEFLQGTLLTLQLSAYGYAVKQTTGPNWTLRSQIVVLLPKALF